MGTETVYITHDGAALRREGERLQVYVRRERRAEFSALELRQVVLMGNITLSPAAIELLLNRGIDTVLLSRGGKYRGRIVSSTSSNIRLRIAQFRVLTTEAGCLDTARRVVDGKIRNQRALLVRHARRHGDSGELARAIIALQASRRRAMLCENLDELRGCEGSASAAYFRVFGVLLSGSQFRFDGRNRRPPLDPVNALLSLGYTLLANAVECAVEVVGLDPHLGALHAPLTGRPSLVCDLVEEMRAPLVDRLVIAAINRGAFKPEDFEDMGPGEPVVLKRETTRWMVTLLERRLERLVLYPPLGQRLSGRGIIEQQARRFARHVLGEEPYECFESGS